MCIRVCECIVYYDTVWYAMVWYDMVGPVNKKEYVVVQLHALDWMRGKPNWLCLSLHPAGRTEHKHPS
jgi:hypothetical protein